MDIKHYITESIDTKSKILNDNEIINTVQKIADIIIDGYKIGKKVLIAGNGGSASDSQHIAAELVSKVIKDRPPLCAIALTVDTSVLTAISNDYGYEYSFSRQIQANGCDGDIFIAISTSGNSKNIIKALEEAKNKNIITIGLLGNKMCDADKLCDYKIKVPSEKTSIIQESHIMIAHLICAIVEESIF